VGNPRLYCTSLLSTVSPVSTASTPYVQESGGHHGHHASVHESSHDSDRVRTVGHTEVSRPQWAASLGQTFRVIRLRSEATSKFLSVQQQVIGTMFVFLSNDSVPILASAWSQPSGSIRAEVASIGVILRYWAGLGLAKLAAHADSEHFPL
jgi:hypothetical protein